MSPKMNSSSNPKPGHMAEAPGGMQKRLRSLLLTSHRLTTGQPRHCVGDSKGLRDVGSFLSGGHTHYFRRLHFYLEHQLQRWI